MDTIIPQKRCYKCTKTKPLDQFNKNRSTRDGFKNECRDCSKAYNIKWGKTRKFDPASYVTTHMKKLGISREDYNRIFEQQNGLCAICGKPERSRNQYAVKNLAMDHDHATGQFRGLLCQVCNMKLAILEDAVFMSSAQEYLERHKHPQQSLTS